MKLVRKRTMLVGVVGIATAGALVACGSSTPTAQTSASDVPACPVAATDIVVTTNVWGSIADQLAGACANVTVVITSPTADPHDYEPTAATSASIAAAKFVVMNGLGYDSWSTKIVDSLGNGAPTVVNLGSVVGLKTGANPHIWYSPTYVQESAKAITAALTTALPAASSYFQTQASTFATALKPYLDEVASIKASSAGTKIGATESVFDYMAEATGLVINNPPGYLEAIANETEPSAGEVAAFRAQLSNGTDKVLIYNSQTAGGLPTQMRQVAEQNNVPVVTVTETLTPEGATFQAWQLDQLQRLNSALHPQTPAP